MEESQAGVKKDRRMEECLVRLHSN